MHACIHTMHCLSYTLLYTRHANMCLYHTYTLRLYSREWANGLTSQSCFFSTCISACIAVTCACCSPLVALVVGRCEARPCSQTKLNVSCQMHYIGNYLLRKAFIINNKLTYISRNCSSLHSPCAISTFSHIEFRSEWTYIIPLQKQDLSIYHKAMWSSQSYT